ncbi:hypothetical protein ACFFX0_16315 [Citricoccus parietis]|uniref:Uncharacterized protein n=1 Tax=Citricoccus parietis TaxID=592307 RepID=A0ABV5G165_9MICC
MPVCGRSRVSESRHHHASADRVQGMMVAGRLRSAAARAVRGAARSRSPTSRPRPGSPRSAAAPPGGPATDPSRRRHPARRCPPGSPGSGPPPVSPRPRPDRGPWR